MVKIDDVFAALLLSLIMYRRLEVLSVREEDNRRVAPENVQKWRVTALSGYNLGAVACVLKVLLSVGWFWFSAGNVRLQVIGGLSIFIGWIAAMVVAWRRTTEANAMRRQFGILGRREASRLE